MNPHSRTLEMMYYNHLVHQQMMMEQYQYHYQHGINHEVQSYYSSSEQREEDTDHTGDDNPSDASGDVSPQADVFRLAFAASQWSKLVLNAEGLFNSLMSKNVLPSNEQDQIEQWLCLKQEYEECIAADESTSLPEYPENVKRSLEIIEEVTETDDKTDESNNWGKVYSSSKSSSESDVGSSEDEDSSGTDSEDDDFLDKLDEYMRQFKVDTDEIVASKKYDALKENDERPKLQESSDTSFVPIIRPTPVRNLSSRRMSILPHSEMSNDLANFSSNLGLIQQKLPSCSLSNYYLDYASFDPSINAITHKEDTVYSEETQNFETLKPEINENKTENGMDVDNIKEIEPIDNNEKQIVELQSDLDLVNNQIEELQNTIKAKEEFICNLMENWESAGIKKKTGKAKSEFKKKCSFIKAQVAHARNMLLHSDSDIDSSKDVTDSSSAMNNDRNTKSTGNSEKKIKELEGTIVLLKKEMVDLKMSLKEKEEHKKVLEDEIVGDQKKKKDSNETSDNNLSNSKELSPKSEDENNQVVVKRINNDDDSDSVRNEIRKLRTRREFLIAKKWHLEKEFQSKRILTEQGKRDLLSITEHIELIDEMIEQKNEIICGRSDLNDDKPCKYVDKQMSIMIKLAKLSFDELMTLVCKYIYKVIDLKDSTRNLEDQINILEANQERHIREIKSMVQKFENLLDELDRYKKKNRALKKQISDYHALLKGSSMSPTRATSPAIALKQEVVPSKRSKEPLVKVTRQKNKLVITKKEK